MIMMQKFHSVRLLVLYDSMHIRFHMACFAIQTHPESSQSLILISLEGELSGLISINCQFKRQTKLFDCNYKDLHHFRVCLSSRRTGFQGK